MLQSMYKIYHANLAFSAIPTESLGEVIDRTYFPLLDFVKRTETKIGLELSGYTLEIIKELRPTFLDAFKSLYKKGLIELIGSGYMQIIAPLVPYEVNLKNQSLGLEIYKKLLEITPTVVYVNEQTFSNSLVDLYDEVGYEAIVMEWNNSYSHNKSWNKESSFQPILVKGEKAILPLLWSDSILFQQFQRVVHFENSVEHYLEFMKKYTQKYKAIPVYTSDLEVFNYRPGRFETEAVITNNEWERIYDVIEELKSIANFKLPGEVVKEYLKDDTILQLAGNSEPIIVKKQEKYSLSRWAACGRSANEINTLCFQYYQHIKNDDNNDNWKKLLTFWGSDFRTHITKDKWNNAISFLKNSIKKSETTISSFKCSEYISQKEKFLTFEKDGIKIVFNLNKGMALQELFKDAKRLPFGTINHGELDYIKHGADYYTGTTVIESASTKKIADLIKVDKYSFGKINDDIFVLKSIINLKNRIIEDKTWTIDVKKMELTLCVNLKIEEFINGTIRLGTFTLLSQNPKSSFYLRCKNGGTEYERVDLKNNEFNQHVSKSLIQSCSSGLGVTDSNLDFSVDNETIVSLEINRAKSYPFIMLQNNLDKKGYLTRVHFSVQELDDTLKINERKEYNLEYTIKF